MKLYLHSKIHHCRVTQRELNYVGSVVIDSALMAKAQIEEYEQVVICNVNNGNRWETYAIAGLENSGIISVQGPGARLCEVSDMLVIITYQVCARLKNKRENKFVEYINHSLNYVL
jgi:aspartate 1-decarboxylase